MTGFRANGQAKDIDHTIPNPPHHPPHSISPHGHPEPRPRPPNQRPNEIRDALSPIRLFLKQNMDFLPALGRVEDDAAELGAGHGLDVGVADLVGALPGGVLGGAGGDEFDDCVVGSLDVDVFGGGVVDGCDGGVGVGGGVGQF